MDISVIIAAGGGPSKLAKRLGRHHSTVLGWTRVPDTCIAQVADATGIPPEKLRPDLAAIFRKIEPAAA